MKTVIHEWRTFLKETERKHPKKQKPRNKYDRTATKLTQDLTKSKDPKRSEQRWNLSRILHRISSFLMVNAATNYAIRFINEQDDVDKNRLLKDIQLLSFIYNPKSNNTIYQPYTKEGGTIFFYDRYEVRSPVFKLNNILDSFDPAPMSAPSDEELKDVYLFYIAPENENLRPAQLKKKESPREPNLLDDIFGDSYKKLVDPPKPDPTKRFAGLNMSPDELERINQNFRNSKKRKK